MSDETLLDSADDYFVIFRAEDLKYCCSMGVGGPAWFVKNVHPKNTMLTKFRKLATETNGNVTVTFQELLLLPAQQEPVACAIYFGLVNVGTSPIFYTIEKESAVWIEVS